MSIDSDTNSLIIKKLMFFTGKVFKHTTIEFGPQLPSNQRIPKYSEKTLNI